MFLPSFFPELYHQTVHLSENRYVQRFREALFLCLQLYLFHIFTGKRFSLDYLYQSENLNYTVHGTLCLQHLSHSHKQSVL